MWYVCLRHREELIDATYKWTKYQIKVYRADTITNYKAAFADGHVSYFIQLAGSLKVYEQNG